MAGLSYTKQGWKPGTSQSNFDMNAAMRGTTPSSQVSIPYTMQPSDAVVSQYNPTITQPRRYTTPGGFGSEGTAKSGGGYSYAKNTPLPINAGGLGDYATYSVAGMDAPVQMDQAAYETAIANGPIAGLTQNNPGMFDGVTAGGVVQGIQAASGLANAYLGYKNYGLSKDKFAFEKAATNRSIANQASEYNTGIQNAGEVGMGLAGGTMDPNARAARQAQLEGQKISGLAIG